MCEKILFGIRQSEDEQVNIQIARAIAHLCSTIVRVHSFYTFMATPEEVRTTFAGSKFAPIPITIVKKKS